MSYDTQTPQAPHVAMRNGLGTAALTLGIIGTVAGVIPLFFWLAGLLGLIALILGLVGRGRVKRGEANNKGVTTTGVVLGLAALVLSVVGAVITYTVVSDVVDAVEEAAPKDPSGGTDKGGAAKGDVGKGLAAGDTAIYDDLKVTVSEAKAYKPSEFAAGHTEGNKAYQVTVVIENGGKEKFDATLATLTARAGKDGVTAEQVFDEKVGTGFSGTILPGKKSTVVFAFDTPKDAKNLSVEVSPGLEHEASQWELKVG
ncbi:DUF4352 domain-containing protein [Streptomyces sp. Je 1-79]|uniref:DUF4352 domain-containing protein n=1 Tax=Streptomyces sp. Je 1-79 TaxID=2943847 RepID=UPI0021A8687D|nr:DUF4352 domain-containing protein [Streptomyces sp. Je 1-79]MCT4356502.1 DUF4352 domain-containing protein [Streptomyces sp. Je 1-79]